TRRWVKEGWVDYIGPQRYWHSGYGTADYEVLTAWWPETVRNTGVRLLIGQASYRAGVSSHGQDWQDPDELSDHLHVNRRHPEVGGDIYFSAKDVRPDRINSFSILAGDHYTRPSLPHPHGSAGAPAAPATTPATRGPGGVSRACNGARTAHAVHRPGTTRQRTFTDTTAAAGTAYTYYVTALARTHQESAPSAGRAVTGSGGGFSVTVDNADAGFTAGTSWGTSAYSPQRHGADYRFADPVAASDPAWFRASIPSAGTYRVEIWHPADPGYNSATPYIVAASGGNQTVTVDQRTGGGAWRSLGTFQ